MRKLLALLLVLGLAVFSGTTTTTLNAQSAEKY